MRTTHCTVAILAVSAAIAWGCGGKTHSGEDADATADGDGDGSDLAETADSTDEGDASDVPGDEAGDAVEEDVPPPPPAWVLEYLGRYDRQAEDTDDLLGTAILDADTLLVASGSGLAVVDRAAIESGTVSAPSARFLVDASETSSLDGAPAGAPYVPRFFHVDASGSHAYASTRYDGLWILDVTGSGSSWTLAEAGRHVRAREFTEGVQVLGTRLWLAHHADGIEVMDLADPVSPVQIAAVTDPLVDVWGMEAQADGKVWVADGAGGVKLLRLVGTTLSYVTGDSVTTAPGTVFDVAALGNWVVAASGGRGITVYEEWTAAQRASYPVAGVCTDVEPLDGSRAAVSCGGWVHVVEVNSLGILHVVASARMHRRDRGPGESMGRHLALGVTADGDVLYVAGLDHVDAYRFVEDDPDLDADVQASGQTARFGAAPGAATFEIANAGQGTLEVSSVDCPEPSLTCALGSTSVLPGGATTLTITFDGSATGVQSVVSLLSNDPDDGVLPFNAIAAVTGVVDPLEQAPDFTGATVSRDYASDAFTDGTFHLDDYAVADQVVHFAIFSTWCPACLPAIAAMGSDVQPDMPANSVFLLIADGDPDPTVRHVLEKIRVPILTFLDTDGAVSAQYGQPSGDLPVMSSYVLDRDGYVMDVFTAYDPEAALSAIDDAL